MGAGDFLDTNVLIYALSPADERRWRMAGSLLQQGGCISVQVLNEFATVARRKLGRSWPEITQALADIRAVCPPPVPVTVHVHEKALDLAASHGFGFYDALIIAAALQAKCTVLLTEDMQDGQMIDGRLTIRNPFR